jgi:hypothetical protein
VTDVRREPSRLNEMRIFKTHEPTSGAWFVEQPYDLDIFENVPTAGPYGTLAEAEIAARWFQNIVSGASD